jgi:TRAP-type C4-dicarboxylate transport system substrate-binding protein
MNRRGMVRVAVTIGVCVTFLFVFTPVYAQQKAAPDKVIELSLAQTIPPVVPLAKAYMAWGQQVEERTGGRVKVKIYWGESLMKASEFYRGVQTGVADMTYYVIGLDWGIMPMNMFTKLAFLGWPSMEGGTKIYHQLWEKYAQIRDEFKNVKVLAARVQPPNELSFTKKEVRLPDDMKGLKVIALGGTMAEEMKLIGAAPIDVKITDCYVSLERGMAEGISALMPVVDGFGLMKLLPHHTLFPGGATASVDMVLMNLKTWNSLPPDIQKVLDELKPYLEQELIKADVIAVEKAMNAAKAANHTIITPNDEAMKQWRAAVQPTHDKWIKDTAAKGLPAQGVYDDVKRLIKEYKGK